MDDKEYNRRQREATHRLRLDGEFENAQLWLRRNPIPPYWEGTPLEYAELEMPVGPFGAIARFFGVF